MRALSPSHAAAIMELLLVALHLRMTLAGSHPLCTGTSAGREPMAAFSSLSSYGTSHTQFYQTSRVTIWTFLPWMDPLFRHINIPWASRPLTLHRVWWSSAPAPGCLAPSSPTRCARSTGRCGERLSLVWVLPPQPRWRQTTLGYV